MKLPPSNCLCETGYLPYPVEAIHWYGYSIVYEWIASR
jgi:hypothetical protein